MKAKALFNKAIYFATLKRFWVGSALYLLLMMLFSGFWSLLGAYIISDNSGYVFGSFSGISLTISVCMAPVVAVLVYRFLHSKKNSVFLHSMPITRGENYISTLLAAFTLMGAPVIIQGIIMGFSTGSIDKSLTWMLYTLFCNIAMFSIATFAATLTGASWVTFPLYIGANLLNLVLCLFVDELMNVFALGYRYSSQMLDFVAELNMPILLGEIVYYDSETYKFINHEIMLVVGIVAVIFFVLSALLYKKRKMERSEDASAYTVFNYVSKYLVTFASSVIGFLIFHEYLQDGIVVFIIGMFIITASTYFATEMILRKSLKVWGSYKGYLVFVICFTAVLLFVAFTSIFGFETYIPKTDNIESVEIDSKAYSSKAFSDRESIDIIREKHAEIVKEESKDIFGSNGGYYFTLTYNLKNAERVYRDYYIDTEQENSVMDALYESENFKKEYEGIFSVGVSQVNGAMLINYTGGVYAAADFDIFPGDYPTLLECIKKDILENSYSNLYKESVNNACRVRIYYTEYDENTGHYGGKYMRESMQFTLTPYYENTLAFLEQCGYDNVRNLVA